MVIGEATEALIKPTRKRCECQDTYYLPISPPRVGIRYRYHTRYYETASDSIGSVCGRRKPPTITYITTTRMYAKSYLVFHHHIIMRFRALCRVSYTRVLLDCRKIASWISCLNSAMNSPTPLDVQGEHLVK